MSYCLTGWSFDLRRPSGGVRSASLRTNAFCNQMNFIIEAIYSVKFVRSLILFNWTFSGRIKGYLSKEFAGKIGTVFQVLGGKEVAFGWKGMFCYLKKINFWHQINCDLDHFLNFISGKIYHFLKLSYEVVAGQVARLCNKSWLEKKSSLSKWRRKFL